MFTAVLLLLVIVALPGAAVSCCDLKDRWDRWQYLRRRVTGQVPSLGVPGHAAAVKAAKR